MYWSLKTHCEKKNIKYLVNIFYVDYVLKQYVEHIRSDKIVIKIPFTCFLLVFLYVATGKI